MPRHRVTSDEIIRAEQTKELILASSMGKALVWYPYTQTYAVLVGPDDTSSAHTSDRMTAINAYNDL